MGATILWCTRCWTGYGSIGEIPARCPACDRITSWTKTPPAREPTKPYALSFNDRRFLRSLRIHTEEG